MKSEEILKIAYEQIEENNQETTLENISTETVIGVLVIPSLKIEAPIKEGTSQEVMNTSIGHFTESDYWNGNVSFASHNSGTSAHYFEKINKLNVNDEIEYITKLGTRTYKVQSIKKIESTDWSMVMKSDGQTQNKENTITLITCITGQPDYRLCVRGVEI
jgi:sortase A